MSQEHFGRGALVVLCRSTTNASIAKDGPHAPLCTFIHVTNYVAMRRPQRLSAASSFAQRDFSDEQQPTEQQRHGDTSWQTLAHPREAARLGVTRDLQRACPHRWSSLTGARIRFSTCLTWAFFCRSCFSHSCCAACRCARSLHRRFLYVSHWQLPRQRQRAATSPPAT